MIDYYAAWRRRTEENGGIMPDNIGLSGQVGECMDGKWWGGYYGYRWPHGWRTLMEATLVAAGNVLLLTGDRSCLDLPRSMLDGFWALGKEQDGVFVLPSRHGDGGWFDYRPPDAWFWIHLYHLSQSEGDLARLARFPNPQQWASVRGGFGKSPITFAAPPWFAWLRGQAPEYPSASLNCASEEVSRRLAIIANDGSHPDDQDVHHWQQRCPVVAGPLPQQTMGADTVYHGGLLHARLRFFDPVRRRPGLPEHVAALVEKTSNGAVVFVLVNTGPVETRDVLVQAGAFGEHRFTEVRSLGDHGTDGATWLVNAACFRARLGPGRHVRLSAGMQRYANRPTYAWPWA